MKKGFDRLYLVAIMVLLIVWGLMTFYISKLPLMGRLDASIGCPFYTILGGIFAGLFGCGFMSIFHVIMAVALVTIVVIMTR